MSIIEVTCEIHAVTPKALLVHGTESREEDWVPRSMISDYCKGGDSDLTITSIFIPDWLAEDKGFI